jgi:SAM-dependent methyltransferase
VILLVCPARRAKYSGMARTDVLSEPVPTPLSYGQAEAHAGHASLGGAVDALEPSGLLAKAIAQLYPGQSAEGLRVLDVGCGRGELVVALLDRGFDAYGCDFGADLPRGEGEAWSRTSPLANATCPPERLGAISASPYRLPFPDNHFDAVVSQSVLEHVKNKRETLEEIRRVTRPGGVGVHLFPSKYYLPLEPHLKAPLIGWFWPRVPTWWLALWAVLGVRNEHQQGLGWREVVRRNRDYCRNGLDYLPLSAYRRLFTGVFAAYVDLTALYAREAPGGAARLARRIPLPGMAALLGRHRTRLVAHRNAGAQG